MSAPTDRAPRLDQFLCFAVYSTNLAFHRIYRPLLDGLGLTYVQYLALAALWDRDDQRVGALCATLFLKSSTLTPVLKRLEDLGLVRRARESADERQVRVRLTDAGRALEQKAAGIPNCITAASGLSAEQIEQVFGMMAVLRNALLDAPPPAPAAAPPPRRLAGRAKAVRRIDRIGA